MISATQHRPIVGIGLMIFKDGKILLGKRKGSHGAGEYAFPGGHFEYMESFANCAARELKEECGIKIKNIRFQLIANIKEYAPRHFVHINLMAEWQSGTPRVLEKEKCESWEWYDVNNLPSPLFEPTRLSIESYKTGKIYYDF